MIEWNLHPIPYYKENSKSMLKKEDFNLNSLYPQNVAIFLTGKEKAVTII